MRCCRCIVASTDDRAAPLQQRAYEMSESVIDVVRYAAPYRLNSCLACFVREILLPFSSTAEPVRTVLLCGNQPFEDTSMA